MEGKRNKKQISKCNSWMPHTLIILIHNALALFRSITLSIKTRKIMHRWCKPGVPLSGLQSMLEQSLVGEETLVDSEGNWSSVDFRFLFIASSERFSSVNWSHTSISMYEEVESSIWSASRFLYLEALQENTIPLSCCI